MCQNVLNFFMRNLAFKKLRKTKVFLFKVFLFYLKRQKAGIGFLNHIQNRLMSHWTTKNK